MNDEMTMYMEDGSVIEFVKKPISIPEFWMAIKIRKDDKIFGISFDQESFDEFMKKMTQCKKMSSLPISER